MARVLLINPPFYRLLGSHYNANSLGIAYIAAVLNVMQGGEKDVQLVARGNAIRTAVDTAEICKRRNGHLASMLPEKVTITSVETETEEIPREDGRMGSVSVIKINISGEGEMIKSDEE